MRLSFVVVTFAGLLACASSARRGGAGADDQRSEWTAYGRDVLGGRYSALAQIDTSNVARLAVAWTYHTGELAPAVQTKRQRSLEATPIVVDGVMYLITPIFLHGGLIHFAFNAMALLQLGPLIEQEYGTERFAFQYLACGIVGNLVSQGLGRSPTVGASGALFGLMGVLLVYGYRRGGAYGAGLRRTMMAWLVPNLLISFIGRGIIDWRCHLGGRSVPGVSPPAGGFPSQPAAPRADGATRRSRRAILRARNPSPSPPATPPTKVDRTAGRPEETARFAPVGGSTTRTPP